MGYILCSGFLLPSPSGNKQLLTPQTGLCALIDLVGSHLLNILVHLSFFKYLPFNHLSFNQFYFNLCLAGATFQNSELLKPRVPKPVSYP